MASWRGRSVRSIEEIVRTIEIAFGSRLEQHIEVIHLVIL